MRPSHRFTESDYTMLWKLSSAYYAASSSACNPVAVRSELWTPGSRGAFSSMFYDCTDPESRGKEIMRRRIEKASEDITRHLGIHDSLENAFFDFEEALNVNHRTRATDAGHRVYDCFENYYLLILQHLVRCMSAGVEPFLLPPTCVAGHYFMIPENTFIRSQEFNPLVSVEKFGEEISEGRRLLGEFLTRTDPLAGVKLADLPDSGEGIIDTSLRGRLALTRELLTRAGYTNPGGFIP